MSREILKDKENSVFIRPLTSLGAYREAYKVIKKISNKNDIIISFGGRVSTLLPLLYFKGYRKLYTYEFNAVMGRSNKLANPFLKKCFTYFPLAVRKESNIGSPLERKRSIKRVGELKNILVLSGSLGSNKLVEDFIAVSKELTEYNFTISNGTRDKSDRTTSVVGLIDKRRYKDFDLVLARSGAGTIADLIASGVPFILLPSKNVKDNHQKKNAEYLASKYGLTYLDYDDQNPTRIIGVISLYKSRQKRERLVESLSEFQHPNVLERLKKELYDW